MQWTLAGIRLCFLVLGMILWGSRAVGQEVLDIPSFNLQEEQDIALSACSSIELEQRDVTDLDSPEYAVRAVAQRRILAQLNPFIMADPVNGYCLIGQALHAIARANQATQSLEVKRRLDSIRLRLMSDFDRENEQRFAASATLDTFVFRGTAIVSAYKAITKWRNNGCDITGVYCARAEGHSIPKEIESALGTNALYSCRVMSGNCGLAIGAGALLPIHETNDLVLSLGRLHCPEADDELVNDVWLWEEEKLASRRFLHAFCRRSPPAAPMPPRGMRDPGFALCSATFGAADADRDQIADPLDDCPLDQDKGHPGRCGCNIGDSDLDGDSVPDCIDGCPEDSQKIDHGLNGCGRSDSDRDGDGSFDTDDECPDDPAKIGPGICACGVADTLDACGLCADQPSFQKDSDGDGTLDCEDLCPSDPMKIAPNDCGCGIPDARDLCNLCPDQAGYNTDSDADGIVDCLDSCPNDPSKVQSGVCGCGVPDGDSDGDGTADCDDFCPADATVAFDASRRCSCFCVRDGTRIKTANNNEVWIIPAITEQDACDALNSSSDPCRNAVTGDEGRFERCSISYVDS